MMDYNSYVKRIKRRLHVDEKTKRRIVEGIEAEIQHALDGGESLDDIQTRMGAPKGVAAEYNISYKNDTAYQTDHRVILAKRVMIIAFLSAALAIGVSKIGRVLFFDSNHVSSTGGVSGPLKITTVQHPVSPLSTLMWFGSFPLLLQSCLCLAPSIGSSQELAPPEKINREGWHIWCEAYCPA